MKLWTPILLAAVCAAGCVDRAAQSQAKKTQDLLADRTQAVDVASARTADLTETLQVTGSFTASQESSVGPAVAGRLVTVYVRDGDSVQAGQAIAQQETQDLMTRLRQARSQADAARAALQQAQSDARTGPTKSSASVRAAQARLAQARAQYQKARNGARSEERTQAEWTVKRTKSDLDTAKANLDRQQRLFAEGAVAKTEVEAAENRYANAMAAYEGALQSLSITQSATRPEDLQAALNEVRAAEESVRLAQADKGNDIVFSQRVEGARANLNSALELVSLAQKALSDATIRSPFTGRVSGKPVQAGTFVAPGASIATIVGRSGLYFVADVPESKIALIAPGSEVSLKVDALRGAVLRGSVIAVDPVASGQGRLFSVRVTLLESLDKVKPGMFAKGTIDLGRRTGVTVVPHESIIRDGENTYLFTVVGDAAKRVDVKTGLESGPVTEVTGVSPGDKVVISGQTTLVDGAKVRIESGKKGA
ncbi:MAG: efflux RND transporter periplasmic adaptor subunit [Armatimonadetes bacterium]|nr:efflux RND transporter periplasmic adaptor subunit [Armatimonadota bacterium]